MSGISDTPLPRRTSGQSTPYDFADERNELALYHAVSQLAEQLHDADALVYVLQSIYAGEGGLVWESVEHFATRMKPEDARRAGLLELVAQAKREGRMDVDDA